MDLLRKLDIRCWMYSCILQAASCGKVCKNWERTPSQQKRKQLWFDWRVSDTPIAHACKKGVVGPRKWCFFTEKSFTKLICPSPLISSYRNLDTTATELPFLYLGCENQSDFANFREIRIDAPCTYYKIYICKTPWLTHNCIFLHLWPSMAFFMAENQRIAEIGILSQST